MPTIIGKKSIGFSMGKSHLLSAFRGSRVEIKPILGTEPTFGWLIIGKLEEVTVKLYGTPTFFAGDQVEIQFSCKTKSAKIKSEVLKLSESQAVFSLPSLIRIDPPLEVARKVPGVPVTCTCRTSGDDTGCPAEVIDIAPEGIGLRMEKSFKAEERVDITVQTPSGPVFIGATVIYCYREEGSETSFRLGLKFNRLLRVDKARWTQLLSA